MRHLWYIVVAAAISFAGCQQKDDLMTTQQSAVVRYLESGHQPRLMSEEAARESLDEEPQFYSVLGHKAYRYIAGYYDSGRDERTLIEEGDTAEIMFDAYIFTSSAPTISSLYWSNRAETIERLGQTGGGLNPQFWSTEPLALKVGRDGIYGVSRALAGCREGDTVEVYMTYDAAYGSAIVGLVPKESPVAWFFTIEKVTKR